MLHLLHVLKVFDRFDVNPALGLIGCEQFWLQIHQAQLSVPILVHDNL